MARACPTSQGFRGWVADAGSTGLAAAAFGATGIGAGEGAVDPGAGSSGLGVAEAMGAGGFGGVRGAGRCTASTRAGQPKTRR